MPVMDVVQATVDEVIHVIAVRHEFMATVLIVVASAFHRGTDVRVRLRHRDDAFIPMTVMLMMQMSIMHIVDMVTVSNLRVTAS